MKIIQVYPGKIWGGAEQYILDLSKALEERGHTVWHVSSGRKPLLNRLGGLERHKVLSQLLPYDLLFAFRLSRMVKDVQPDVLHIHGFRFMFNAIIAKRWARSNVRIVLTRHEIRRGNHNPLYRWAYRQLHHVICVSQKVKDAWMGNATYLPADLGRVIINSIPDMSPSSNTEQSLRERFGIDEGTPLVVFSGRVRRSKGCMALLEALANIKQLPWALVYIGACKPASYQQTLMRFANERGIADRVFFTGFTSNARQLMGEADIGAAPSIVRESCGLTVLEFMKAGVSLITSNSGGQVEFVNDNEIGLVVERANVGQLEEALKRLLVDKPLRDKLAVNAKRYFDEHLNYSIFMDKTLQVYK